MIALMQEERTFTKDLIEQESTELQNSHRASRNLYKKVFQTNSYNLFDKLFDFSNIEYVNFIQYNNHLKGEKRIIEYFSNLDGVKLRGILPIIKETIMSKKEPYFTPLSKDTIKNVVRKLKVMSLEEQNELAKLGISIREHGMIKPVHDVRLFKLSYEHLLKEINTDSPRIYTMQELQLRIAALYTFVRNDRIEISKKIWGTIFTHSDYKRIIQVFTTYGILTKTSLAIKGWKANTYVFNVIIDENAYATITDIKALKRIKDANITFPLNSLKKQLEMAQNTEDKALEEDIKTRMEGFKYIASGFDYKVLKEEYKWISNHNKLASFGIHFLGQKRLSVETGVYRSYNQVQFALQLDALEELLKEQGIKL